jgi:hypothetical protein
MNFQHTNAIAVAIISINKYICFISSTILALTDTWFAKSRDSTFFHTRMKKDTQGTSKRRIEIDRPENQSEKHTFSSRHPMDKQRRQNTHRTKHAMSIILLFNREHRERRPQINICSFKTTYNRMEIHHAICRHILIKYRVCWFDPFFNEFNHLK